MTIRNPKAAAKVLSKSRRMQDGQYNQYNQYQQNGQYQQYNGQMQGQQGQYNGQYNGQMQGQQGQYNGQYNGQGQDGQNWQQGQYNGQMQGQQNYGYNGNQNYQGISYRYGNFEDSEYPFLAQYSLKLIGCYQGMSSYGQDGAYSSATVAYRLCPASVGCDNSYQYGCDEGYGDYLVGIDVFTQAFYELEEMREIEWNEAFDVSEFVECSKYDGNNDNYGEVYVGPTCAADGVNIALGVFSDENCYYQSQTPFEYVSNGYSLPFADGGLVNPYCVNCIVADADDDYKAEYAISEFCEGVYEETSSFCETNMQHYSQYGLNTYGCSTISEVLGQTKKSHQQEGVSTKSKSAKKGTARKVFVVLLLLGLLGGIAYYVVWWRKQKADNAESTANKEGTMA